MSPEAFREWNPLPAHWEGNGSDDQEDEIVAGYGYCNQLGFVVSLQ